jgi:hypothetical protein
MTNLKINMAFMENRGFVKAAIIPFQAMMVFLSMPMWVVIGGMGFLISNLAYRWLEFKSINAFDPEHELRQGMQLAILVVSSFFAISVMLAATMILPINLTLLLHFSFVSFLLRNCLIVIDNFLKMSMAGNAKDDLFKAYCNILFATFGIAKVTVLFFDIALIAPTLLSPMGVAGSILVFVAMLSCDLYMAKKAINNKQSNSENVSIADEVPSKQGIDYSVLINDLGKLIHKPVHKPEAPLRGVLLRETSMPNNPFCAKQNATVRPCNSTVTCR